MASIVETSIKRPLLIIVVFTVLTLGGLVCYSLLNLNLLPKIELPTITITTIYPGAGASEVETSVTKKIEDALSTLENLKKISSISQEGVSVVTVQLNEGTDANLSVQDAQRKINAIKSNLPKEILDPSINKISIDEQPIMRIAASSSLPPTQFYKLTEDRIQPRLAKLPGVGAVDMVGGNKREIKVNIDAEKLKAYKLQSGFMIVKVLLNTLQVGFRPSYILDRLSIFNSSYPRYWIVRRKLNSYLSSPGQASRKLNSTLPRLTAARCRLRDYL